MQDRVLLIDDEDNLRLILDATLTRAGYEVKSFSSFASARETLNSEFFDVVITDLQMPVESGMDVLNYCKLYSPDLPVVMITAFGTVESAVNALKAGAFDFILKPFENESLFRVIQTAIESRKLRRRDPALELMSAAGVGPVPVPLFGQSKHAENLREAVARSSRTHSPVMLVGENGTGKRSIAYEIHRKSDRARFPFIQVNVQAIPPVFQVSELFGVEKGASPINFFTKPGSFELAKGGTLFIEEFHLLSVEAQNAIFQAMESEQFNRLGGVNRFSLDFRLIVTVSKEIDSLIKSGVFHVELFDRVSVERIDLFSLRERREDVASDFIPYFLEKACQRRGVPLALIEPDLFKSLCEQDWLGNLGELQKRIEQLVNHSVGGTLRLKDFNST